MSNFMDNNKLTGRKVSCFPLDKREEARLGSIFMACLLNIPKFANAFFPKGTAGNITHKGVEGYLEVTDKDAKKPETRLDAIFIYKEKWAALFEFKSGSDTFTEGQIKREVDFAKQKKIPYLITISNDFTPTPERLPYNIDKKIKTVTCLHFSWTRIRTIAHNILQATELDILERSILSDFNNFLSDSNSGCKTFNAMPTGWSSFVSSVTNMPINKNDTLLETMITAWQQEVDDMCLNLERKSAYRKSVKLAKHRIKLSEKERYDMSVKHLCEKQNFNTAIEDGYLSSPIEIIADIKSKSLEFKIHTDAPPDKDKPQHSLNWLKAELFKKDQLDNQELKGELNLSIIWKNNISNPTNDKISNLKEKNYDNFIPTEFKAKQIKTFCISYFVELRGDFSSNTKFVSELEKHAEDFYIYVAQYMPKYDPKIIVNK